ncbi:hypothetical protein OB13_00910, partial [Pontibacter sp. HJ8]
IPARAEILPLEGGRGGWTRNRLKYVAALRPLLRFLERTGVMKMLQQVNYKTVKPPKLSFT